MMNLIIFSAIRQLTLSIIYLVLLKALCQILTIVDYKELRTTNRSSISYRNDYSASFRSLGRTTLIYHEISISSTEKRVIKPSQRNEGCLKIEKELYTIDIFRHMKLILYTLEVKINIIICISICYEYD